MAKNKTVETEVKVEDFLESFVEQEWKKEESRTLIKLMQEWSKFPPKMWGPSIIGFGSYHYKYASGHEGDMPLIGFSPRKAQFSFYVYSKTPKSDTLLQSLGKYKMGKACIYVKKLANIDLAVLEGLCRESILYLNEHFECSCHD